MEVSPPPKRRRARKKLAPANSAVNGNQYILPAASNNINGSLVAVSVADSSSMHLHPPTTFTLNGLSGSIGLSLDSGTQSTATPLNVQQSGTLRYFVPGKSSLVYLYGRIVVSSIRRNLFLVTWDNVNSFHGSFPPFFVVKLTLVVEGGPSFPVFHFLLVVTDSWVGQRASCGLRSSVVCHLNWVSALSRVSICSVYIAYRLSVYGGRDYFPVVFFLLGRPIVSLHERVIEKFRKETLLIHVWLLERVIFIWAWCRCHPVILLGYSKPADGLLLEESIHSLVKVNFMWPWACFRHRTIQVNANSKIFPLKLVPLSSDNFL